MIPNGRTDAELVGDSLNGSRPAFAEIVRRYQTLACSLAYSATGDLARSEDLAQETFLTVWQRLPELREREKLRSWICGIVRNRVNHSYRRQMREPTFKAETLEFAGEAMAPEPQPSDQAVSQDETAIMWRSLERIPEIYREPLILFHRENQSIERVAAVLDLTEDAVKQRLVRGRKLLHAEVESVVEGALRRSVPGPVFTSSVMEALPAATAVAKTGSLAAKVAVGATAAAKGSIGGTAGFVGMIVTSPATPLFVVYLVRRMANNLITKVGVAAGADARWAEERTLRKGQLRIYTILFLATAVMLEAFKVWSRHLDQPRWYVPLLLLVPASAVLFVVVRTMRTAWLIREVWTDTDPDPASQIFEYSSRLKLGGLPLLHILLGSTNEPARGWLAVGNVAYGGLFACGTIAFAPICLGVFGVGLAGFGVFMAGGLVLAVLPVGVLAAGVMAFGWMAAGLFAFGFRAAYGFAAYAFHYADFPSRHGKMLMAYAQHAHDVTAKDFFSQSRFFTMIREVGVLLRFHHLWCIEAVLLFAIPILMVTHLRRLPFRHRQTRSAGR